MAIKQRQLNPTEIEKYINLAKERFDIRQGWIDVDYQKEADVLYIRYSNCPSTYSDDDLDKGLVFDYDQNNKLVGVEILNFLGTFVPA